MAPLTIRNLSSIPLDLKLVERFSTPGLASSEPVNNLTNLARNFTSLASNATSTPEHPKLADDAQPHDHSDVSIGLSSFQTTPTDIDASPNEVLRLTFEHNGERYRVDAPTPTPASTTLTPLKPSNESVRLSAVYHPSTAHLALFSSANLLCWMAELSPQTPLAALSIPGTHNSPTCHRALPSVRCQAVSVAEQLKNGVRFLDIRVQPEDPGNPSKDGLILVHGVFPISLTGNKYFRDLANEVLDFLHQNPSETVIMSVKREGPGQHTDAQLSKILFDHYTGNTDDWFTAPRVPTLGEARAKIVLMRRFTLDDSLKPLNDGRGYAINAEIWAYNTPSDTCPGGEICVQDFCEVLDTENVDKKIRYSQEHLERAGCCVCPLPGRDQPQPDAKPPPLYVNFLSASNFWKVGCWPEKIAAKLNPAIVEWLCQRHNEGEKKGDGATGVVVCDWVGKDGDWDLVRCIVGFNAGVEMREKQLGV